MERHSNTLYFKNLWHILAWNAGFYNLSALKAKLGLDKYWRL